jgi:uncharacterized membrane protein
MPTPSVFFAVLGAVLAVLAVPLMLRRVPPNPLYGLRVPATFRDAQVWYDANAASGRDLLVLGIVLIVSAYVVPAIITSDMTRMILWQVILVGGAIAVAIIGWRRANRMLRERSHTP